jgi:hypothetical protein
MILECINESTTTSRVTAENFSAGVLPDELATFTNFC